LLQVTRQPDGEHRDQTLPREPARSPVRLISLTAPDELVGDAMITDVLQHPAELL
jgi:hypothetical protein